MSAEFRKIFDTIPEQFDRCRPRYSAELFASLIGYAGVAPDRRVLELGPGTGQATAPILATGCDYCAIELGEHLSDFMRKKYGGAPNFRLINDDFITHDFGEERFDMIYSAATIQWIPEEIAFAKTFALLKPGGTLAMMLTHGDYRTPNPALFERIQSVYAAHFCPTEKYVHGKFRYDAAPEYGYTDFEKREFPGTRIMTAEQYVDFSGTHCDHLVIPEPHRTQLFDGLRRAVLDAGDRIEFRDTYFLYLAKKPL